MPELRRSDGKPAIWFETRGEASNEPLVLLHGFTGTHRSWDAPAARLVRDHLLVLPDLPGHGMSGVSPSRAVMSVARTADAIAEIIELVGGGRKAAVVGYSLGGRVALDLACRHEALLSRLILEGASPGIEGDDERAERRARDDVLADDIERLGVDWFVDYWQDIPLFATQKELPANAFEGVRRDRLSNTAQGLAMSLRAAGAGSMAPLWRQVEGIRIPVLLVVGKKDERYTKIAGAMRSRIPGSKVVEVEGAGHCVHLEKPGEFADLVERFLADRSVSVQTGASR